MSCQSILTKVCIMELSKIWKLPSLQNVIQGYYWRQNELEVGKDPKFKPTVYDVASFSKEDINETWNFANLGNTLLSSWRIKEKMNYSNDVFSSLKALAKERPQSLHYLKTSKSNAMKCLILAHANYSLTIPLMKKISPALISGERCLHRLICPMSSRVNRREIQLLQHQQRS